MSQSNSILDIEPYYTFVLKACNSGKGNAQIVREFKQQFPSRSTSDSAIRRFRNRYDIPNPLRENGAGQASGTTFNADGSASVTGKPFIASINNADRSQNMSDPEVIMKEHGFDAEKWQVERIKLNRWDGPIGEGVIATYHQVTLHLKPVAPAFIVPVRSDGWVAPKRLTIKDASKPRTVAIFGDPQAPYYDPHLLQCAQEWLYKHQPDEIVHLGDTVDFPGEVSRHPNDPDHDVDVMTGLQSGYDWLRAIREAALNASIYKLAGNHDERIRNYLIKQAPALFKVSRVGDTTPVWSLEHLMRLDELGVEFIDPLGPYDQAEIKLSDYLAVRHGWIAKKGGGASALASLEQAGYSMIVGHTHRQSIVHKTTHDIDGSLAVIKGVEAGCMCLVDPKGIKSGLKFPTYANFPDWQQGFCTATIFEDGRFNIDLATYVNGKLFYRDDVPYT